MLSWNSNPDIDSLPANIQFSLRSQLALCTMAKRMVWTRRVGVSGKPAAIRHQALFTMSLALGVVHPLDPIWKISWLLCKNCTCTLFIVHLSFLLSKNCASILLLMERTTRLLGQKQNLLATLQSRLTQQEKHVLVFGMLKIHYLRNKYT